MRGTAGSIRPVTHDDDGIDAAKMEADDKDL